MVLQDYNEVTQAGSKSANSKDRPHSSGPSGRRGTVIHKTSSISSCAIIRVMYLYAGHYIACAIIRRICPRLLFCHHEKIDRVTFRQKELILACISYQTCPNKVSNRRHFLTSQMLAVLFASTFFGLQRRTTSLLKDRPATVEPLINATPNRRTPPYNGHFTESQMHSLVQILPLCKGQNFIPQLWPL